MSSILDRLTKIEKKENFSKWQGEKGLYVFRHLELSDAIKKTGKKAPVAQVYKDRKYLSGVFRTSKPLEFSGDILDESGKKHFIRFVFLSADKMEIMTLNS